MLQGIYVFFIFVVKRDVSNVVLGKDRTDDIFAIGDRMSKVMFCCCKSSDEQNGSGNAGAENATVSDGKALTKITEPTSLMTEGEMLEMDTVTIN